MNCAPVTQLSGAFPTVADIRATFYPEGHPYFLMPGDGTFAPWGFTLAELNYLFYKVKKFSVTGTLPGQNPTETSLTGYPTDGLRQHIFRTRWTHATPFGGAFPPYIPELTMACDSGVFYDGKWWPSIQLEFIGEEGEDETFQSGWYGTNATFPPAEPFPVGTVRLLDQERTLYGFGEPDPPDFNRGGAVYIDVEEEWSA